MYCTLDDIRSRLEESTVTGLCDDDGDGVADSAVVAAAIADAAAEIDAALGGRYALPLAVAPPIIRAICAWLAIGGMFRRRRETPSTDHESQAAAARTLLGFLADGRLALAGVAPTAQPECSHAPENRATHPDTLTNF